MDYKEKLKLAKKAYSKCVTNAEKRRLESIFPELAFHPATTEDEKIRKEILDYFKDLDEYGYPTKEWTAWVEKQVEQAGYNPYKATIESITAMVERYADNGDLKDFYDNIKVKCKDAMEYDKTLLEKQGEQKETLCDKCKREQPSQSCQDITELGRCALEHQCEQKSNKVGPKFKVGDKVLWKYDKSAVYIITEVRVGGKSYWIERLGYGSDSGSGWWHDQELELYAN